MHTIGKEDDFGDFLSHFIMPYLTLTIVFFAELTRYVKVFSFKQTNEEYVVVQQAFQATKLKFHKAHYKNVLIPV